MRLRSAAWINLFGILLLCLADASAQTSKSGKKEVSKKKNVVIQSANDIRLGAEDDLLKARNDHDSVGQLLHVGTVDSVPALLRVLQRYNVGSDGTMICTRSHALTALSKITGQNLGTGYDEWAKWWE